MAIVTSLPNIFDPNILLNKKTERITDLMGDNEFVLIRENMTTILRHIEIHSDNCMSHNYNESSLYIDQ